MLRAIPRYGARVLPNTMQLVAEAERRGTLLEGPDVARFEAAFAERLGDVHAVSTSFGRMAFLYILEAMNFPAGSEIVIPALTFWVIPEMARVAGLKPVFADVDPITFNMTAESLARAIGPKTVAVVPTHIWGLPCDMDAIMAEARAHGLAVIEDCAHALGAFYRGRPVGTSGDAALFSFQTMKPLNTYGGGMAVARDPVLAARIGEIARREPPPTRKIVKDDLWRGRVQRITMMPPIFTWTLFPAIYVCERLGVDLDSRFWEQVRRLDPVPPEYRRRYSNVQAILGLEGLKYLDQWTRTTQDHAARMTTILRDVPGITLPSVPADRTHVFYQYCAYLAERDPIVVACLRRGVDLETLHVDVCPRMPLFSDFATAAPNAERTSLAIQLPVYSSLAPADLERVGSVVREVATSFAAAPR